MQKISGRFLFYVSSLVACSMMALTSGCASGGFKLTRQYAGWVNSQNVVLRVILYILTIVVFTVTILIDAVVFNTIDFWEGRVSAGSYEFKDATKVYYVKHEYLPNTHLRQSTIHITDLNNNSRQDVVMSETAKGDIEVFVDGHLKTRVKGVSEFPIASFFDENGKVVNETSVLLNPVLAFSR
ncbi:MAG: DUF3332 family protein [Pseudobdellovibrionaceae bacterium]